MCKITKKKKTIREFSRLRLFSPYVIIIVYTLLKENCAKSGDFGRFSNAEHIKEDDIL